MKKATLVLFTYDDGSSEYASGAHAEEVMAWLNAAQAMTCHHGAQYRGRKMVEVRAPNAEQCEPPSTASAAKPESL